VKLYVEVMYSASVPSELGNAVPRRGALNIRAGVKSEVLEAVLTEEMLASKRATSIVGDLIQATILTIFLEMIFSK